MAETDTYIDRFINSCPYSVRENGFLEGFIKGFLRGFQQGVRETNLKHSRTMKDLGLPLETIQKVTGLTSDEISKL